MPYEIRITKPRGFRLAAAVRGHGWYDLAPFRWDESAETLEYVFADEERNRVAAGEICESGGDILVKVSSRKVSPTKVERDVRHMLRMDDELTEFYSIAASEPGVGWVAETGAGRLLRSPTVFEDLIKTMCTTNCSWSLTRSMVNNLVSKLGTEGPGDLRSFPSPGSMASVDEAFYRGEIKAGYRAPYFAEIAERVAEGKLGPESFLDPDRSTDDLRKELKAIKGFGDYAADNMLKLLGRYEGLALDSWLRSKFYEKHNKKRKCPDKRIVKHYQRFGKWKGLVIWCDMTEDWFTAKQ